MTKEGVEETGDTLQFQCPCGAFLPTWAEYALHAMLCSDTHSTSVSIQSLPVFQHPPLSHFTEHTVGFDRTRLPLPSTPVFFSNVFWHLQKAGFNPTLYGSYQTVYATQTSDMDIALGHGSLRLARTSLQSSRLGTCRILGNPGERNRRHMKVYAPGVGRRGHHIDVVSSRDNDGPQKKQILLNLATVLPIMSHLKSVLKTMASATGCLAPGTRGQKTRAELLAKVEETYDTSSPEALLSGVLLDWCAYNKVSVRGIRDSVVCKSIVDGTPLPRPEMYYLPPTMQALVEPLRLGLERGETVPPLVRALSHMSVF
ncbi:hypothetical protein KIPB_005476 [Kipferlia bialata]|uniref:Uncharacterized protein n=1 Tax=Kipferlia bialata TaxID=797122 RepID=A0A9K3CVG2_9EUKA|nr:hypothetical protein KIPB_005476 [Kipferlia bialata]|eukprot:g5476.t1